MYLFFALFVFPIVWGIVGLIRQRMPISGRLEIRPPHVVRYALLLIMIPVSGLALTAASYYALRNVADFDETQVSYVVILWLIIVPLCLAFLLIKAKRIARPIPGVVHEKITVPPVNPSDSKPDFRKVEQQMSSGSDDARSTKN